MPARRRLLGAVCVMWLFLFSVATAAPPQGADLLAAARKADAAEAYQQVIALIQEWLQTRLSDEIVAEAFYLIGKASWREQRSADAVFYLRKLIRDAPHSPWVDDASVLLGQISIEQGATRDAIGYLEKAVGLNTDPEIRRPLYEQLAGLYQESGRTLKAVETWLLLQRWALSADDPVLLATASEHVVELIERKAAASSLRRIVEAFAGQFPADLALLRLADVAQSRREPYEEEQWLEQFVREFPRHPKMAEVTERLETERAALRMAPSVMGVLLPLSGPARLFGQSALRGVQVSWDAAVDTVPGNAAIGLAIRDSQRRDSALNKWVRDYDIVAMIGPLLSREVMRASSVAKSEQIPIVSPGLITGRRGDPTMDLKIIEGGDPQSFLFYNGLTLAQQARTIADYAVNRLEVMRFMILYPDEPHGETLVEVFTEEVLLLGGEVIARTSYAAGATDFRQQIRTIKKADLDHYGHIGPPVEGLPPDEWPYERGFDAVYVPGDAQQVGMIAAQLAFHGYEDVVIIGVGGWNRPELLTFGGEFIEGGVFVDGFFAQSESPAVKEFVQRYQMRYDEAPDLFAAQAYDATRMVIRAIELGATDGTSIRDQLRDVVMFPGVSGLTTLVPGYPAQKQLFVLKIEEGKVVQIN